MWRSSCSPGSTGRLRLAPSVTRVFLLWPGLGLGGLQIRQRHCDQLDHALTFTSPTSFSSRCLIIAVWSIVIRLWNRPFNRCWHTILELRHRAFSDFLTKMTVGKPKSPKNYIFLKKHFFGGFRRWQPLTTKARRSPMKILHEIIFFFWYIL